MNPHSLASGHVNKSLQMDTPDEGPARDVQSLSTTGRLVLPYPFVQHLLAFFDVMLIIFSSLVGGELYQLAMAGELKGVEPLLAAGFASALLYFLIGQAIGYYDLRAAYSRRRNAWRIVMLWCLVGLLLTFLAFLFKVGADFSRGSIICFATLALISLLLSRPISKKLVVSLVAAGQVRGRRAILVGARDELSVLTRQDILERFGLTEIYRVAFAGEQRDGFSISAEDASSLDQALQLARDNGAHEILLALPWNDTRKLELVRDYLRICPLPIQLLPDRRIRSLASNPNFNVRRSLSIEIQRGPLSLSEQWSKRVVDVIGAAVGLALLAPLIALTAIAVKLDSPGPVLFRQRRNGFNAKQFAIYKFRTMTVMEDGTDIVQATRFDKRITRVGGLLRQTSIDEVPQLLNVLFGDMSLVGPRPHALAHDSHYGDLLAEYAFRHHVKPGITGWAAVNGYRGETALVEQMKGRIDHDIWYINNWSLILDIKILTMTCFEVVRKRNAY